MSKKNVPAIVSAMGVLMSLLDGLVKAVKAAGGTMENLRWLATSEGEEALAEIGRLIVEAKKGTLKPTILPINRAQPFDSVKFLGQGWSIEEEDKRSLGLTEVDLAQVRLEHMLEEDETIVNSEERLRRLKEAGHIRLDAKIFQALWENQASIPESWKDKTVYFDGTVLRRQGGDRCVLALCWSGGWLWRSRWLGGAWSTGGFSAVLASV